MGVAAAQVAAPEPAPRAPAATRPRMVLARTDARLVQRSCDCGNTAGLSGRCSACDRTGLRIGPASLGGHHGHAADEALGGAGQRSAQGTGTGQGLGHDLGRLRIASPGPVSTAPAGISAVRHTAPVRPQTMLRVSSPGDRRSRKRWQWAGLLRACQSP